MEWKGRLWWVVVVVVAGFVMQTRALYVVVRGDINDISDQGQKPELPKAYLQVTAEEGLSSEATDPAPPAPAQGATSTSGPECALPSGMAEEIRSYQGVVDRIIDYVLSGEYKGRTYSDLAYLVDTFGPRQTGTGVLEAAIDWMVAKSYAEGLDNVHTENVSVPHWVRNNESAWMVLPRLHKLNILGLGSSVGTPPEGITAEVLVVNNFEDLKQHAAKAAGKIIVYNPPWESYSETVQYRSKGASLAAQVGAVAALVRSVTPFSINSPHTGEQFYMNENLTIPVACITVEDAAMMERMQVRGDKIEVTLSMGAQTMPQKVSRNTVVEVQGAQLPNETVLVSGHLDSWDVGQGAMDDGGGMMISWGAVVVLRRLGLRPRRTVRGLLWTGEEQGLVGSLEYYNRHKEERDQFQLMLESDIGTFTPLGLAFNGTSEATCIIKEVLKLLHRLNSTQVVSPMDGGPDIEVWMRAGVPTGSLLNDNGRYFWFHHSDGDTLSVEDPDTLDRCLAFWTSVAYVTADMKGRIPHSAPQAP